MINHYNKIKQTKTYKEITERIRLLPADIIVIICSYAIEYIEKLITSWPYSIGNSDMSIIENMIVCSGGLDTIVYDLKGIYICGWNGYPKR